MYPKWQAEGVEVKVNVADPLAIALMYQGRAAAAAFLGTRWTYFPTPMRVSVTV
jgi:hypothetical protein